MSIFVVNNGGCLLSGCCVETVGVFDDRDTMLAAFPNHKNVEYEGTFSSLGISAGELKPINPDDKFYFYDEYVRNTRVN